MRTTRHSLSITSLAVLLLSGNSTEAAGPLPGFTLKGVALHPDNLSYAPTKELEHPSVVKMEGRVKKPLGRYYMYYAPHKHVGIGVAYADSLAGPWKEHEGNPVLEGPAAPDIRWIEEQGRFYLWGHRANKRTELWTSEDGLRFEYRGVSVDAKEIGTRNATYSRVYEYPLEQYGSKYIMLYSGYLEDREIRCVWLAHSKDAENWTQVKTPLVEPTEGENSNVYGPALFRWANRNFVVYQDGTAWRGGNIKYVEVDRELNPVGGKGERFVLMDPPPALEERYRGGEFYREGNSIYLITGASRSPRTVVYATAEVGDAAPEKATDKTDTGKPSLRDEKPVSPGKSASLDEILESVELETVYETSFEEPLRWIHEDELIEDKTFAREPPKDVDWVLEGRAEVSVKSGRMHMKNDEYHCVLWNTRTFPDSFVAEWDFKHEYPQGTAILFFAAQDEKGGSIFTPGLPMRGGKFGNYTKFAKGKTMSYHTSYSATDEKGVPRASTHLKKNGGAEMRKAAGISPIDESRPGKTGRTDGLRCCGWSSSILPAPHSRKPTTPNSRTRSRRKSTTARRPTTR